VGTLLEMAGISHGEETSQELKPYRIKRDNDDLQAVVKGIDNTVDLFQGNLPHIYCFSTGRAASQDVQLDLTCVIEQGNEWRQEFVTECQVYPKQFEKPMKRRKVKNFSKGKSHWKRSKDRGKYGYTRDTFWQIAVPRSDE